MKTIVLGATPNPNRYAYLATDLLQKKGIEVVPIGKKKGTCGGLRILCDHPIVNDVHTVTIYLGYKNQLEYYDYILSLHPKRVIFNPGAENEELARLLHKNSISTEVINACTLVMLKIGNYNI